jgi:hypothetical protein
MKQPATPLRKELHKEGRRLLIWLGGFTTFWLLLLVFFSE